MGQVVDPLKIDGLRDFQAALKALDGEAQKQLRVVFNRAADLVVADARRRVPTRSGAAAGSVRAASGQRQAAVKGGDRRAPYFPWLDYGGRVGRSRGVSRPYRPSGRYVYPAYKAEKARILGLLADELAALAQSAGLKVS